MVFWIILQLIEGGFIPFIPFVGAVRELAGMSLVLPRG